MPNTLTIIGFQAFAENNIKEITIPDSVREIKEYAFAYSPITSVTIGAGVNINGNARTMGRNTGFKEFYDANGKTAGSYEFKDGAWGRK